MAAGPKASNCRTPRSPGRRGRRPRVEGWRQEALRTNLWVVPAGLRVLTVLLFIVSFNADRAASRGALHLPS